MPHRKMDSAANDTSTARRRQQFSSQFSLLVLVTSQSELDQTEGWSLESSCFLNFVAKEKNPSVFACLHFCEHSASAFFFFLISPPTGIILFISAFPNRIQRAGSSWLRCRQILGNCQPQCLTWQAHVRAVMPRLTATYSH